VIELDDQPVDLRWGMTVEVDITSDWISAPGNRNQLGSPMHWSCVTSAKCWRICI